MASRYEALVWGLTPRSTARYRRKKADNRVASGGTSSATPFLDEITEPSLVPSGDFAHEVSGQLEVALRTGQADVSKIRG